MKRLVGYAILCLVCSGCAHKPPPVTVCVSDPEAMGFQCNAPDGTPLFVAYDNSGNYVALSPEDAEKMIEWMKRRLEKCD